MLNKVTSVTCYVSSPDLSQHPLTYTHLSKLWIWVWHWEANNNLHWIHKMWSWTEVAEACMKRSWSVICTSIDREIIICSKRDVNIIIWDAQHVPPKRFDFQDPEHPIFGWNGVCSRAFIVSCALTIGTLRTGEIYQWMLLKYTNAYLSLHVPPFIWPTVWKLNRNRTIEALTSLGYFSLWVYNMPTWKYSLSVILKSTGHAL